MINKYQDVIVVNILREVINSMTVIDTRVSDTVPMVMNYQPGSEEDITKILQLKDASTSLKKTKYPLIAVINNITERRGERGYYAEVNIKRIVLANITRADTMYKDRYLPDGNFVNLLYPMYYEFLEQLSLHKNIITQDSGRFEHTKEDVTSVRPLSQGISDFVDTIEILNLKLNLTQSKICK